MRLKWRSSAAGAAILLGSGLLGTPARAQDTPSKAAVVLPTGDGGAFQQRMMDWDRPVPRGANEDLATIATWQRSSIALGRPLRYLPRISSQFGMRLDPLGLGRRMHAGVDLPGSAGSPVLATGGGLVSRAGWSGGYGFMVEIDHGGGMRTRYGHLEQMLVSGGQTVRAGEVIGLMGSTGHSTGPHLHYEVRFGGRAVNPLGGLYQTRATIAAIAPYLPPQDEVAPRWRGWAQSAPKGQLPSAAFP